MNDATKTAIAAGCGTWLLFNLLFNFHSGPPPNGAWLFAAKEGFSTLRLFIGLLLGGAVAGGAYFVTKS